MRLFLELRAQGWDYPVRAKIRLPLRWDVDSSKALQVAKDYAGRDAEVVPVAIWPDGLYGFTPETHRLYWVLRANASLRVGAAEYVAVSRESGAPQTVFCGE